MLLPAYLSRAPDNLVRLYGQVECDILVDMAERIAAYDYYISAAQWQRQKLLELGHVHNGIQTMLSGITGKTTDELDALFRDAGGLNIKNDTKYIDSVDKLMISDSMSEVINAGLKKTHGLFKNLTKTTANTATKQFENALDRAYMQVTTGAFDYNSAVKSAIKQLSGQGIGAITYPTGHIDSIEVAVRRAVITGVNQTTSEMTLQLCDELECDLVEVSAHAGARPSHAEWQGQIYSRSGRNPNYGSFDVTGYGTGAGLCGWNCSHSFNPYVEGSKRAYSDGLLDDYNARNIEYNGKKLTEYEATQQQRYIERNIRRWKRENIAMDAAGQDTGESAAKLRSWREKEKDFIKQTGLKRDGSRVFTVGWGRSEAANAVKEAKKIALRNSEKYNKAISDAKAIINSVTFPKTLNIGNQNKHIIDSAGYISGRSYIYGDLKAAQDLVYKYSGTGVPKLNNSLLWTNKEFVVADNPIGVVVDRKTGLKTETKRFSIHYGKSGTHIVPAKER